MEPEEEAKESKVRAYDARTVQFRQDALRCIPSALMVGDLGNEVSCFVAAGMDIMETWANTKSSAEVMMDAQCGMAANGPQVQMPPWETSKEFKERWNLARRGRAVKRYGMELEWQHTIDAESIIFRKLNYNVTFTHNAVSGGTAHAACGWHREAAEKAVQISVD